MLNNPEIVSEPNLVAVFSESIDRRYEELTFLRDEFAKGMELVSDIDKVNEIITTSTRPDLTMTEQVELMKVEDPTNLGHVNNFVPNMTAFGTRVFEDRKKWDDTIEPYWVGRIEYTDEQRATLFQIGARGDYNETHAYAAENGIDEEFADQSFMQTHINQEAFMRMWIVLPELTERLMDQCLYKVGDRDRPIREELFVSYNLMAKLVDKSDRGVVKEDGSVDTWHFCH